MRRLRLLLAGVLVVPVVLAVAGTAGAAVYFVQTSSTIGRASLDGEVKANVVTGQAATAGLAVTDTHIYWARNQSSPNGAIRRARLDGTNVETVVANLTNPQSVAVDDEYVYYGQSSGVNKIGRARLDGTENNPDFITGVSGPSGLAVNATHIFWTRNLTTANGASVGRANIDGSEPNQTFISGSGLSSPIGVAVNASGIYWANHSGGGSGLPQTIGHATLSGIKLGTFVTAEDFPRSVAASSTHVYWSNAGGLGGGTTYGRAPIADPTNLDQGFITGATGVFGLAVDSSRGTTTALVCTPTDPRVTRETECTATVTDAEGGTKSVPAGTVNLFNSVDVAAGTAADSCTLVQQSATTSGCEVTYTPSAEAPLTLAAIYAGGGPHAPSRGNLALTPRPAPTETTTELSCTPDVFQATLSTACTVTVSDPAVTPVVPTGIVGFSTDADGDFEPEASCTLAALDADSASCQIQYEADAEGPHVVSAAYGGDDPHAGSGGNTSLTILPPPFDPRRDTSVVLTCTPSNPRLTRGANCMASVADVDTGTKTVPAGTIEFDDGRPGNDPTCTLAAQGPDVSRCGVSYTPAAVGAVTLEAAYDGSDEHEDGETETNITVGPTPNGTQTAVSCNPDVVRATEATFCTVTVRDTATTGALRPTGDVELASDLDGAFHPGAQCTLAPAGPVTASCSVAWVPSVQGENLIGAFYAGDEPHSGDNGTVTITVQSPPVAPVPDLGPFSPGVDPIVTPVPPPPNAFSMGKPKLKPGNGTATLRVRVQAGGRLILSGAGVRKVVLRVDHPGPVMVAVRAQGKALRALRRRGRVKLKVRTAFTPFGGSVRTRTTTLTLKLKPKESPSR